MSKLAWVDQDATTWADLDGTPWVGVVHLPGVLDGNIVVEFAWGADLTADPDTWQWVDETHNLLQDNGQRIVISPMGRSDETPTASLPQPAGCAFQLLNTTGEYTTYNATRGGHPSAWKNTPVRATGNAGNSGSPAIQFQGYLNGLPPSWDTSGKLPIVSVSASGDLRRLTQGTDPLKSAMTRYMTDLLKTGPVPTAWWPMEDGASSVRAVSPIHGVQPLSPGGTKIDFTTGVSAPINFAGTPGPGGTAPLPTFQTGSFMSAILPPIATATSWRVDALIKMPTLGPTNDVSVMQLKSSGDVLIWEFRITGGSSGFVLSTVFPPASHQDQGYGFYPRDQEWHHLSVRAVQNGANIDVTPVFDNDVRSVTTYTNKTLAPLTEIFVGISANDPNIVSVGQIMIWHPSNALDIFTPATGYNEENMIDRLNRIANQENIRIDITGGSDTRMGPQGIDTAMNLINDCVAADLALLYDGRGPGLGVITREARYNAPVSLTADMAAGQVAPPFAPADNDQRNRNRWTVAQEGGSQATYEDVNGPLGSKKIGTYKDSLTINIADDGALKNIAAWLVHQGTVVGYRYPTLYLNMAASPELAADWLATPLNGRIDVLNVDAVAPEHPPGDVSLLLEGCTQVIWPFGWTVTANSSLADPWNVAVVGRTRVDTLHSFTSADVAVGATSFQVRTDSGHKLWTPGAGLDYYVVVSGLKIHVTGISGTSSPQTFTVGTLSTALPTGSQVRIWRPDYIAL